MSEIDSEILLGLARLFFKTVCLEFLYRTCERVKVDWEDAFRAELPRQISAEDRVKSLRSDRLGRGVGGRIRCSGTLPTLTSPKESISHREQRLRSQSRISHSRRHLSSIWVHRWVVIVSFYRNSSLRAEYCLGNDLDVFKLGPSHAETPIVMPPSTGRTCPVIHCD